MTEQLPTNQVSLDDLKRSLEALPDPQSTHPEAFLFKDLEARAKAWRAAFKWHRGRLQRYWDAEVSDDQKALELEEIEGIRLVEKLR